MNVGMSDPNTLADPALPAEGILAPPYRAATVGMVALISLIAFEALAVTTAMPTVARELNGLKAYALAFGGVLATSVIGMTLSGRWSDRKGPAPAMWTGLAGFVVGLLIAGFAHDMPTLLVGRLVQGLGAGCLSPALYVIVGRLYPESLRPKVFAAFSAGWVVPALIGPAVSGAIVEHVGWRWVFLGVVALTATGVTAPADPPDPLAEYNAQPVKWAVCSGKLAELECATLVAPLDYTKPAGDRINLTISRKKATAPEVVVRQETPAKATA